MIILVSRVTSVVVRWCPSAVSDSEIVRVPGVRGMKALSIVVENAAGSILGEYGSAIFSGARPVWGGGAGAEVGAMGAADVLLADGEVGAPAHAAQIAVNDTAAIDRSKVF
jgi:hypothetical protein